MKFLVSVLLTLFCGVSSFAGQIRTHLDYDFSGSYYVPKYNAVYNTSGYGIGFDYLFGDTTYFNSEFNSILGMGIGYGQIKGKLKNTETVGPAGELSFNLLKVSAFAGFSYAGFGLEIPVYYAQTVETDGVYSGAEKTGLGYGAILNYYIAYDFTLGVAYEHFNVNNGKTTTDSTTLANKVEVSNTAVTLGYSWSL